MWYIAALVMTAFLFLSTGYSAAQGQAKMTAEEQLEIVNLYAADLERLLKRCQLERADFQAQGMALSKRLAHTQAHPQEKAPASPLPPPQDAKGQGR